MKRPAAISLVLVVATLAVYAQTLSFDYVELDDPEYVRDKAEVSGSIDAADVVWAFTTTDLSNWHPLTWLSHMADVALFGKEAPGAQHAVNVALHALAALLLFWGLRAMTGGSDAVAGFVAGVFALHPLQVEGVAWISERKNTLAALAWVACMALHAANWRAPTRARSAGLLACHVLGLMAKPLGVTLPFALLLLDHWPLRRPLGWRLVREKWALFAASAAMSVVTLLTQVQGGAVVATARLPLGERIPNALVAYADYLGQTLWPTGLAVFYPHPTLPGQAPLAGIEVVGAGALLLGLSVLAAHAHRRGVHAPAVGWLWFLGVLVPMIGLVQAGFAARADRYMTIPIIGLALALAGMGQALVARRPALRTPLLVAAIAALVALAPLTWRQVGFWRDTPTLFDHSLAVTGESAPILHNYGYWLQHDGQIRRAMRTYRRAIEIDPLETDSAQNFALLSRELGDLGAAVAVLERAERARPGDPVLQLNLGSALYESGRLGGARRHLERAIELDARGQIGATARQVLARLERAGG